MTAAVYTPPHEIPLRVLTPDLGERLRTLNNARTQLRANGLEVECQAVRQNSLQRPFIRCAAGTARTRLLLKHSHVQTQNGVQYLVGLYMGCDVAIPMGGSQ
jgi:hypothetical protein